ncbi:DUF2861 family protein [Vibrio hepatarius]|uniref:DUF2861 family protein n=1 Tax=Vibrio hepatarius TaxID=171383 RepID=UPI001C08852A|nr:DUF2861 family protein [Vibrio hepatarius]MBU2897471.1 DUF2861 family protein [Vibrio hepatarius]
MKYKLLFILYTLCQPHFVQASWFTDTSFQAVYQALINHQPKLAWQELILALSRENIESGYWLAVKQEILSQTSCGQKLVNHAGPVTANISIAFIRRSGLSSQGFQIKLSAENTKTDSIVELIAPSSTRLLKTKLPKQIAYQEIETKEMLIKPSTGVYQLRINDQFFPLLIAIPDNKSWLTYDSTADIISISFPKTVKGCSQAVAAWQWFDNNYIMLDSKIPIQKHIAPVPQPTYQYEGAKHLSASVSLFEYQQGIKIDYIQRVAIPFSPFVNEKKDVIN